MRRIRACAQVWRRRQLGPPSYDEETIRFQAAQIVRCGKE